MKAGEVDVAITEARSTSYKMSPRASQWWDLPGFLHTNGGVMVLERSGITRPRELAGKRVQYPGAPGPGGLAKSCPR